MLKKILLISLLTTVPALGSALSQQADMEQKVKMAYDRGEYKRVQEKWEKQYAIFGPETLESMLTERKQAAKGDCARNWTFSPIYKEACEADLAEIHVLTEVLISKKGG